MNGSYKFDSIESVYKGLNDKDEIRVQANFILLVRNWLTEISNFDPVSGIPLPTGIVQFLNEVTKTIQNESADSEIKDRVYRIMTHTEAAILAIIKHTRDKILREHAMLPIYAAREVDSNSVQWLSRQPGRTLREKLSGKPYMKAVRRRFSLDTTENRLLKAFIFRLEQVLLERQNIISAEREDVSKELLVSFQRWLRAEDVADIAAWGNFPPNNTLLQDKRYRKVWDAWLWLQAIDEQIAKDSKRLNQDILNVIFWNTLSLFNLSGRFRIIQQPVGIDYDKFMISHELPITGYLFPEKQRANFSGSEDTTNSKHSKRFDEPINEILKQLKFTLLSDRIVIHIDRKTLSILIDNEAIVLTQNDNGEKIKFKINPEELKGIPKALLSLITGATSVHSFLTKNQDDSIQVDSLVIDLCSIRPTFVGNIGSQASLPFRLLLQNWKMENNTEQLLDCGTAKAIRLSDKIETISMRSLFLSSITLSDANISRSSMFFIKKLEDFIKTDEFSYLVPDWGNDFDLEVIRKSVNFYFNQSVPLPKSIAAVFAWQSAKSFMRDKKDGFIALIVDSLDEGISITPLQAVYQKELHKTLPETAGFSWERHPTTIVSSQRIYNTLVKELDGYGCQTSKELLDLFAYDGLANESGKLSVVKDNSWYHLENSIREDLLHNLEDSILSNEAINDCLKSINKNSGVNVFILPIEVTIRKPKDLNSKYQWINHSFSLVLGGQALNKWQKKVPNIALWRDHLPELSIQILRDGGYENFYLVKDAQITPQRGKTVKIPVKESFTFPAGPAYYSFPLQQGKGNKRLQFNAYIKSPAFPLKKDTNCRLEMTYTYGADTPYELKFIPHNSTEAGFESIRVEWRSASKSEPIDLESLPIPKFPARKKWFDFQRFPKKDGSGYSDLLDWCSTKLENLTSLLSLTYKQKFEEILTKRKVGYFERGGTDINEKYFCLVNVEGERVFCHSSQFIEEYNKNSLHKGSVVYLDVSSNEKGAIGKNISFSKNLPSQFQEKLKNDIERQLLKAPVTAENGIFSIRFPVFTIWNHGHSLSEADAPKDFINAVLQAIKKSLLVIESESMPNTLKEELFFFLSCLHKDAPKLVSSRLLAYIQDAELSWKYHKNIAYAIGDADLPWQQELLKGVITSIDNERLTRSMTIEILSIVLWRSKTLIYKMPESKLTKLSDDLFTYIQSDKKNLTSNIPKGEIQYCLKKGLTEDEAQIQIRSKQIGTLTKHLELLLALLRSREIKDEAFKLILAPNKELTQKYVNLLDEVGKTVINKNIEFKSRISLEIKKPKRFHKTPDLLYALRLYLTGDSGANTISISGVSDE